MPRAQDPSERAEADEGDVGALDDMHHERCLSVLHFRSLIIANSKQPGVTRWLNVYGSLD